MARRLSDFLSDSTGATAVEYAVVVGGIFLAIAAAVPLLGQSVAALFDTVANAL